MRVSSLNKLGKNPPRFQKKLNSREDLIEKTLSDISSFNREKAAAEVDKFLMDAEMVNLYIQFMKEKEKDPDFEVPATGEEEEGFFSFRTVLYGYLGYLGLSAARRPLQSWVAEQEAAGTWHGTGIPVVDDWIRNAPAALPSEAVEAKANVAADTVVQAVSDAVEQSSGALQ